MNKIGKVHERLRGAGRYERTALTIELRALANTFNNLRNARSLLGAYRNRYRNRLPGKTPRREIVYSARSGAVNMRRIIALALLLLAAPVLAQGLPPIVGRAEVEDGDTLVIAGQRVRLQGIDAPEMDQTCEDAAGRAYACGFESAWVLEEMIGGRAVTCVLDPRDPQDRYGRPLGLCRAGATDLNAGMVRAGQAVAYRRYLDYREGGARPYKADLLAAEDAARAARAGIWRGRFDLPELWRRGKAPHRR